MKNDRAAVTGNKLHIGSPRPSSLVPRPCPLRGQGFTLIEILVVIFLVGIMVSVVVLSIGGNDEKEMRREILRLKQVMQMAQEEAILSQQQLAIRFSPHGYEFNILLPVENNKPEQQPVQAQTGKAVKNQWQELDQPKYLLPHQMREDFDFKLLQEGIRVPLDDEENEGRRIILANSGEMTEFELYLRYPDKDRSYHLLGSPLGELFIEELEERDPNLDPLN